MTLTLLSLVLMAVSGWLLDWHHRSFRQIQAKTDIDPRELRASQALYHRRMRASGIIGVLGAMLIVRPLVPETPLSITIYLLLLVSLCGVMLLLAFVDSLAMLLRYRSTRKSTEAIEQRLKAELAAARERAKE